VWFSTILFPLYSNIWITTLGFAVYMALSPFIEAAEQTVIQKVVEPEKQGRVFGTAQSVEMLASPITAITIGPFTQEVVLPFLQEGVGYDLIGNWFGSDIVRAMALVFIVSGGVGVVATIAAVNSSQYKLLLKTFKS
jgi:DHA3 family multidrug efflux protein-like MFS transporter